MNQSIKKSLRYAYMREYIAKEMPKHNLNNLTMFQKFAKIGSIIGEGITYGLNKIKVPFHLEEKQVITLFSNDEIFEIPIADYKNYCFSLLFENIHAYTLVFGGSLENRFHTQECMLFQIEIEIAEMLWKQKWFRYCKTCNAQGGGIDYQTRDEPEYPWTCECTDPGDPTTSPKCPRCGEEWKNTIHIETQGLKYSECEITKEKLPCPFCNWNWGKNKDDSFPSFPGCDCHERES